MTIGIDRVNRDIELEIVRRAYAKQIMATFGVVDRRVEAALPQSNARLSRPRLGSRALGTWLCADPKPKPLFLRRCGGRILPERNLNNRQPSLHALMCQPSPRPVSM